MLEIYKCLNSENPSFMRQNFQAKDVAYNLKTKNLQQLPSTNTMTYGNDSLSSRGAILWNTLSDSIKSLTASTLRDQLKGRKMIFAHVEYEDKRSVGILPEAHLYCIYCN